MVDQAAPVDKDSQKANFCVVDNTEFWNANIYRPLDPTKKEIRILRILPATETDEIVCELEQNISLLALSESQPWNGPLQMFQLEPFHASDYYSDSAGEPWDASDFYRQSAELVDEGIDAQTSVSEDSVPPSALQAQWYLPKARFASLQQIPEGMGYFGLSYVVGDVKEPRIITVDGTPYKISRNLDKAIRRLRQLWPRAFIRIWIDQICINQSGVRERGHQVKMMSAIYRHARGTVAWLGDDEQGKEMTLCEAFYDLRALAPRLIDCGVIDRSQASLNSEAYEETLTDLEEVLRRPGVSDSIMRLSSLPYWSRLWIVQEVLLSRATVFVYGSRPLTFQLVNKVTDVLRSLCQKATDRDPVIRPYLAFQGMSVLRKLDSNPLAAVTAELRLNWRENRYHAAFRAGPRLKASDRRDYVYGMLGFLGSEHGIEPDYSDSNTTEMTFIATTKAIIKHDGNLAVLNLCYQSTLRGTLDLPSWVPNLSEDHMEEDLTALNDPSESSHLPKLQKCTALEPLFLHDNVLECSAKLLGRLAMPKSFSRVSPDTLEFGKDIGTSADSESVQESFIQFRRDCIKCAAAAGLGPPPAKYPPTGEDMDTAIKNSFGIGALGNTIPQLRDHSVDKGQSLYQWTDFCLPRGQWRFFVSPDGILGLAPAVAESTDVLAVLFDNSKPVILRPLREQWGYDFKLIGRASLHGFDTVASLKQLRKPEFRHLLRRIRIH